MLEVSWSEQYPEGESEFAQNAQYPACRFSHSRTRTSPFPPMTSGLTIGRRNTCRSDYADLVILKGEGDDARIAAVLWSTEGTL